QRISSNPGKRRRLRNEKRRRPLRARRPEPEVRSDDLSSRGPAPEVVLACCRCKLLEVRSAPEERQARHKPPPEDRPGSIPARQGATVRIRDWTPWARKCGVFRLVRG